MEVPEGLHEMQYATNILENVLGWPAVKSHLELLAACLTSIGKSRRWTNSQAYRYLVRAITLAKEQKIDITTWWFKEAEYLHVRPQSNNGTSGINGRAFYEHYGQGYGTADVKWLLHRYFQFAASLPNRGITEAEVNMLLDELDTKRGRVPAWRVRQ
jgi:hypothetical protein